MGDSDNFSLALANAGVPLFSDGYQVRMPTGGRVRLHVVRNLAKWSNATMEAARDHYANTRLER